MYYTAEDAQRLLANLLTNVVLMISRTCDQRTQRRTGLQGYINKQIEPKRKQTRYVNEVEGRKKITKSTANTN